MKTSKKRRLRRMSLSSILLASSLIASVFGANAYGTTTTDKPAKMQTIESSKIITEIQAKEMALKKSKGGLVVKTQLEEENGDKKYIMTILNQNKEFEVEINATTGKVLKIDDELKKNNEQDDNKMLKRVSPKISLESAKKIALNTTQGTIKKVELDNEENQPVFEIKIKTMEYRDIEVKVDAVNGKVLGTDYNDD